MGRQWAAAPSCAPRPTGASLATVRACSLCRREWPRAQGGAAPRASLAAFNVAGLHANDVCTLLDQAGVATRSGHHCTQPLHRYLDVNATARASAYIYNTPGEVETLAEALRDTIQFFKDINGA